jgi:hypothetical protein
MSKYDIYDLEMFVQKTRVLVYNSFGTSSKPLDEIDMDFENLNTLASKGLVDSAFDEETNDFVFWAKDLDDENEDKNNKT